MGQTLSICWKNRADWIQSQQTIPGEKHLETVPLCWKSSVLERLLALTKGDAEFALINAKVSLQSWKRVFLQLLFPSPVTYLVYLLNTLGKGRFHSHWHHREINSARQTLTVTSLWLLAFVKAILLKVLQWMYLLWHCPLTSFWLGTVLTVVWQIAFYFLSISLLRNWVGICHF